MSPYVVAFIYRNMSVIEVKNIAKKFDLDLQSNENSTIRDKVVRIAKNPLAFFKRVEKKEFWALRNINFNIEEKEAVGIIGMNGAGKSTLLKIISGITCPTYGKATIKGRIVSLLEVGTGFHPELTGRENIFLNGAIHKMSRKEIKDRLDDIIKFSGVEEFLDMPIKFYSSGMYIRLAFSVAAHVNSEVLLIDEVLSVGDYEFQKKCLKKIDHIIKNKKRTIMFVSHNMEAVKSICNKVIWLKDGIIRDIGDTNLVIQKYLNFYSYENKDISFKFKSAPGNEYIKIKSLKIVLEDSKKIITINDSVIIECSFWSLKENNKNINLSLVLYNSEHCVLNSISPVVNLKKEESKFRCKIPGNLLNNGMYYVKIIFSKNYSLIFSFEEMCSFNINDSRTDKWFGPWSGVVRPKLNWQIEKIINT